MIRFIKGDITKIGYVDAIVNAANKTLEWVLFSEENLNTYMDQALKVLEW